MSFTGLFGDYGYRLVPVKPLDGRVWLERETFSGGYYPEARERNKKRLTDANKVFVDHANRVIYGPTRIIIKLEVELLKAFPPPPAPDPDDAIDELYAEQQDLREDHPRYHEFYDELEARILAAEEKRAAEMSAYFKARNPMPSQEELTALFASIDRALGRSE